MVMCLRDFGMRDRVAVICAHDALCKKIVAEEGGDHQVLTEQFLKERLGKRIPGDGVSNGREDPVQLADRRSTLRDFAWDIVGISQADFSWERVLQDKEAYRHGYGVGQTGGEDVSR